MRATIRPIHSATYQRREDSSAHHADPESTRSLDPGLARCRTLASWTTSLVAAQGFWKIVERRFGVHRDSVQDQVNRVH